MPVSHTGAATKDPNAQLAILDILKHLTTTPMIISPPRIFPAFWFLIFPCAIYYIFLPCFQNSFCPAIMLTSPKAISTVLPHVWLLDSTFCKPSFHSTVSQEPACPNTRIHYSLYTAHSFSMPAGPLNFNGWERVLSEFPDKAPVTALLGICKFGARIGYKGFRTTPTIYLNLPTTQANGHLLSSEIVAELSTNRI